MTNQSSVKKKYVLRKRKGWNFYHIYCPEECVSALRMFYKQWKIANYERWCDKPNINSEEGVD